MIVSASGTPKLIYILSYRVFIIWTVLGCQEGPLQQRSISFKKFLNNSNRRAANPGKFAVYPPFRLPSRRCAGEPDYFGDATASIVRYLRVSRLLCVPTAVSRRLRISRTMFSSSHAPWFFGQAIPASPTAPGEIAALAASLAPQSGQSISLRNS